MLKFRMLSGVGVCVICALAASVVLADGPDKTAGPGWETRVYDVRDLVARGLLTQAAPLSLDEHIRQTGRPQEPTAQENKQRAAAGTRITGQIEDTLQRAANQHCRMFALNGNLVIEAAPADHEASPKRG